MRYRYILSFLFLSTLALGQYTPQELEPCKPLDQMAAHYDQLARTSQRMDIWDWDVHYYDLGIGVDIEAEEIHGAVEIHFTSNSAGLENIQLDFSGEMVIDSIYLNAATYNHFSDILSIVLDGSYEPGQSVAVGIAYHGHPVENGFKGFDFQTQYNQAGRPPMISTLSEPYGARTWWPCKDVPTDKADSVRVSITVEDGLTAVSNGLLVSETPNLDGTRTWVWEHHYPITTYLVSLAITDYHYWNDMYQFADGDSMLLEYWMYPSYATEANVARWNLTGNMLDAFGEAYGKYPFYEEKYGMAQFEWGGAMEHQTCSSMGSSSENTIAHELAHQWWGDLVTCSNFHHIWINEGFATYSEALWWGEKFGEQAYHAHMATKDNDYNGSIYRNDTTSISWIFNYIVYGKGAWTLHMLRHVVGDSLFFETLSTYRDTYQFSHASTEDFQGIAEQVWGQDLEWFFDQWIYGSGKPVYEYWWGHDEPDEQGNTNVIVHVEQTQGSAYPIFKMPIDLHFEGPDLDTTVVIWDSLRAQGFNIQLPAVPLTMGFDEQKWIHKYAQQVAGVNEMALPENGFQLLDLYPNPFNAQLTLSYMTMGPFDGKLSIYNIRGAEVFSQPIQHDHSGHHQVLWNAVGASGQALGSGLYLLQIQSAEGGMEVRKVSLLK
jgi:aminopeptidase N